MKNTFFTLPNFMSLFRIIIIPFFVIFFTGDYRYGKLISLILFTFASITDFFDGLIARKFNLVTEIGIFLDQFADKLLVLTSLILFLFIEKLKIPVWFILIIIFRDVFVTYMRIVIKKSTGKSMKTSYWGKWKSAVQMFSIVFILIYLSFENTSISLNFVLEYSIPYYLILLCVVLTIISFIKYIIDNYKTLKEYLGK